MGVTLFATPYQCPTWDGIVLREISLQRQVREGNGGHSNGSLFMLLLYGQDSPGMLVCH